MPAGIGLKELPKVYFERLLESSPDIVVAVDRDGTIIFYNDGATRTLGYDADEVLGKHVSKLYVSDEEARRVMAALRSEAHGGSGRIHNFECELRNKSGDPVPAAMSGSIIYDQKGREHGSIGFAKDIAELRLHEKIETLGQLAIGLAHEINNPLETLVNQAEMLERYLKRRASPDEYSVEHERIAAIKRELRHIQSIVERVGEMADDGSYGTIEYLPGKLMTDLGLEHLPEEEAAAGESCKHELAGKTILIVDDDADVCESVADILRDEGCEIITNRSGSEALETIDSRRVDLVLSDVVMPDMDGYDLFQSLQHSRPELPVVLMTAYYYDKDHVLKRSKAGGLQDVIFKKPIKPARLLELIDARVGH
jgi:PAS domain S-box-containing protein